MRIEENLQGHQKIKRAISGRYMAVKSASAELAISGRGIEAVHIGQAETYDLGELFTNKEIHIQNTSTANNAFVIEVTQQRLTKANENNLTVNTTATIENGDDNTHLPRVTIASGNSAVLAVANASRKYLRVAVPSDAIGPVTLGKSGIAANSGGLLEPGMIDYMETQGVLHAFNANSESIDIYVMEINKL